MTNIEARDAWEGWYSKSDPLHDLTGIRAAFEAGYDEGARSVIQGAERVGLPPTPFFYTVEQVATLLQIQKRTLETRILFFKGRSIGAAPKGKLVATNMSPEGETPDWRIMDKHFVQYLRFKNIRFQSTGYR